MSIDLKEWATKEYNELESLKSQADSTRQQSEINRWLFQGRQEALAAVLQKLEQASESNKPESQAKEQVQDHPTT